MKRQSSLFFAIILFGTASVAQNVGIGTSSPSEKLHVNGNINMTGSLRVNGVSGQAGQVLTTNGSGNTQWNTMSSPDPIQYKNFVTVISGGQWIVPAGTYKILVQAWGAGGGGNPYAGGGGGGYVTAHFGVKPNNTVTIVGIGTGGSGVNTTTASNGTTTTVDIVDSFNTTYTLYALGGGGANSTGTVSTSAFGGYYSINPGHANVIAMRGQPGFPNTYNYVEKTAGNFAEIIFGGGGGSGANTTNTGGIGGNVVPGGRSAAPSNGVLPGGGGGSSASISTNGGNGAGGYVIIWY